MKQILLKIILLILFMSNILNVNASSGQLKKDSIKSCNGITYGQHSSDNHWHVASESKGRYYATGDPIYSDPCTSQITQVQSNNLPNNYSEDNSKNNPNNVSSNTDNIVTNSHSNVSISDSSSSNNNSSNNKVLNTMIVENSQEVQQEEIILKSNDNTLKTIIIDGQKFDADDNINYTTKKEKVEISSIVNDEKATYTIKNNSKLLIGENIIIIEVMAEDGTIKIYKVNINREKILSSDKGIIVIINEEKLIFDDFKSIVYVSSTDTNYSMKYKLNDSNSKVEMNQIDKLKTGNNILKIKVIAEDGSEQIYEITIYKYSKIEEIIYNILAISFIGCFIYGIYFVVRKIKHFIKK